MGLYAGAEQYKVLIWPERPGVDRIEYGVYVELPDGTHRGQENNATREAWPTALAHTLQHIRDGGGGIFP